MQDEAAALSGLLNAASEGSKNDSKDTLNKAWFGRNCVFLVARVVRTVARELLAGTRTLAFRPWRDCWSQARAI